MRLAAKCSHIKPARDGRKMVGIRRWSGCRYRVGVVAGMIAIGLIGVGISPPAWGAESATADRSVTFEKDVRPILKTWCFGCHGAEEKPESQLDLRLRHLIEKGGDSGAAIVIGRSADSLLIQRLKKGEMPPGEKKVPADQIAMIERWIDAGAVTLREEPASLPPGIDITPEERAHWAYQPIRRVDPPQVKQSNRVRTPVDAFLLAKLEERGLSFSADADRVTLIRRASFDLTGLPPSQAEIDQFVGDASERAYESMIQRLLDSPRYGEHWGRHWLDVVGYADSEGNGGDDSPRQFAYKYRDYVIRVLNADKPFNRFVTEQLAGDELVPQPWNNLGAEQIELLAATGFLRMGVDGTAAGGEDPLVVNQVVADALKIFASSLMGLTVGCAQCHDHKYDPIPQVDYYRLRAVFEPAFDAARWRRPNQRLVSLYTDADRAKAAAVEAEAQELQKAYDAKSAKYVAEAFDKELTKFPEDQRELLRSAFQTAGDKRTPEQSKLVASNPSLNINAGVLYQYNQPAADELKKDAEKVAAKRAEKPAEDFVSVLSEVPGAIPATHLMHRGDPRQPKNPVLPGDLTIAALGDAAFAVPEDDPQLPTSGRRLALAQHLMSGKHPLVGRVLVNRIWLHHFERGLVENPGDFGALGASPSHPELLDWLADEWVRMGWSLKKLHMLLMTSTVYRQASQRNAAQDAFDSDNRLLGHYPLRRLSAESVRDRMLFAAGTLDKTMFGPAIAVEEDSVGQVVPKGDSARRSIYLQARRTKPVSLLTTFDAPVMTVNCERRVPSTSAAQSLMLMNSDFVLKQAGSVAERIRKETPAEFGREHLQRWGSQLAMPQERWQFGWGEYDETPKLKSGFQPLSHWTGAAWQGGPQLPDAKTGWVMLYPPGGHPGDSQHSAIRRWTAPQDGIVQVTGTLKHGSENGDGIRGRIIVGAQRIAGIWPVKASEVSTEAKSVAVKAGDTIDFVVDSLANVTSDSFEWKVEVQLQDATGKTLLVTQSLEAFHGPLGTSLVQQIAYAWQLLYHRPITDEEWEAVTQFMREQTATLRASGTKEPETVALIYLCQQLLSSNEFLYVD